MVVGPEEAHPHYDDGFEQVSAISIVNVQTVEVLYQVQTARMQALAVPLRLSLSLSQNNVYIYIYIDPELLGGRNGPNPDSNPTRPDPV